MTGAAIRLGRALSAVWLVVSACGGDDGSVVDAWASDAGVEWAVAAPAPPVAPALPALPVLTPCPSGWRELSTCDGATACDPWPATGIALCAGVDEAHFVGEPGCARVGSACPVDGLPTDLPAAALVIYVRSGASGGDGSRTAPFGTIREAIAVAPDGAVVAIGPGLYEESLVLSRDVTLWGACVAETAIAGGDSGEPAVTVDLDVAASIRNIRIGPHGGRGIFVRGELSLRDSVVDGVTGVGVAVGSRAAIDGDRVVVRRVSPSAAGALSVGIASGPATVTLRRAVIEDIAEYGMIGGSLELEDVAVRDIACGTYPGGAIALESTANLTRIAIDRVCGRALFSNESPVDVHARDLVIRDLRPIPAVGAAVAVHLNHPGSVLTAERAWIAGSVGSAGFVAGNSSTTRVDASLTVNDAVIESRGGTGVPPAAGQVSPGASLNLTRVRACDVDGWYAFGTMHAADVSVHWTRAPPSEPVVTGMRCGAGGSITVERLQVQRGRAGLTAGTYPVPDPPEPCVLRASDVSVQHASWPAVFLLGADAELARVRVTQPLGLGVALLDSHSRISDIEVVGVEVGEDGDFGWGLLILRGTLEAERMRVAEHSGLGVSIQGIGDPLGTSASLRDVRVAGGRGGSLAGEGDGMVFTQASVNMARVELEENRGVALQVFGTEGTTTVTAEDLLIRHTRAAERSDELDGELGRGISVEGAPSTLSVVRGIVEANRELGVAVFDGALELSQTRVLGTMQRECAASTCAAEPGGSGIGIYRGRLTATDVLIEGSALCGIHEFRPGAVSVANLRVRRNPIGICMQEADNLDAFLGRVVFEENESDYMSTGYYVPEPARGVSGSPVP